MSRLLQLKQASLSFGHSPIIERVDLTISQGERLCIVGRNGAGEIEQFKRVAGGGERGAAARGGALECDLARGAEGQGMGRVGTAGRGGA